MTDSSSNTQTNEVAQISFFVEKIWPLSGIVATVSIIFSFIHDWGFFYELGISFAQAPTSISDHVQSWLVWLPHVVVVTFMLFAFDLLSKRIEYGGSEREIVDSSANSSKTKKLKNSPWILIIILGALSLVIWLLWGSGLTTYFYIGVSISWLLYSHFIFSHPTVRTRYSKLFRYCFYLIPVIFYTAFVLGQVNARILPRTYKIYSDPPELVNEIQFVEIELIRSFGEWLLIRNDSNNVAWLRIDRIYSLELLEQRKTFPGLLCVLNERFCLPNA